MCNGSVEDFDDVGEVVGDDSEVVADSDGSDGKRVREVGDDGVECEAKEQGTKWVTLSAPGGGFDGCDYLESVGYYQVRGLSAVRKVDEVEKGGEGWIGVCLFEHEAAPHDIESVALIEEENCAVFS